MEEINEVEKENIRVLMALYHGNHLNKNELERTKRILYIMELELKRRLK